MNDFIMTMLVLVIVGVIYFIECKRHGNEHDEREPITHITPEHLDRHIDKMHQLKQQRNEIDDLITNLELCSPRERIGMVQFHWMDTDGTHHELDMFTDGTANTKRLIAVAKAEREEITSSLLRELEAAYYGGNVTETCADDRFRYVTETIGEVLETDD